MKIFPIITIALATFCVVNASPQDAKNKLPSVPVAIDPETFAMNYPPIKKIPDINDPKVKEWLKELDLTKVPDLPISNGGVANQLEAECDPPTVIVPNQGSWTCQKFTAEDDIQTCPNVGTWGLTYDDGPSNSTTKLLAK